MLNGQIPRNMQITKIDSKDIENVIKFITSKEIELVIRNVLTKKNPDELASLVNSTKPLKKN